MCEVSPEAIPVDLRVMYVITSATDSFNIHTSLVWLDHSLALRIHVNSNYNGHIAITMYACTHFTCAKTEGSSNARVHTHMSVALYSGSPPCAYTCILHM